MRCKALLASTTGLAPFDLHVSGLPPAFILSQDQTHHALLDQMQSIALSITLPLILCVCSILSSPSLSQLLFLFVSPFSPNPSVLVHTPLSLVKLAPKPSPLSEGVRLGTCPLLWPHAYLRWAEVGVMQHQLFCYAHNKGEYNSQVRGKIVLRRRSKERLHIALTCYLITGRGSHCITCKAMPPK